MNPRKDKSTRRANLIKLANGGDVIADLEIEETVEGPREKGILVFEGGVRFRTPKNKTFFLNFSEFSFVVNPSPATLASAA